MKCERCEKTHDGSFGSGRFCSKKCACTVVWSDEMRRKHSESMKNSVKASEAQKQVKEENRKRKENHEYTCERCGKKVIGLYGSGRFCSKQCANSRVWTDDQKLNHKQRMSSSQKVLESNKSRKVERIKKTCLTCNTKFLVVPSENKRKFCSRECFNLSPIKSNNAGGYRQGSGRGKSGWYKNYYCDSTYELVWVIFHIDHNIQFERNTTGFEYAYRGKIRKYYPDFYLIGTNEYVEVKGYNNEQFKVKIDSFPHRLKVLFKADMKKMFDYVHSVYGSNYIELYTGNPHNILSNDCHVCGKKCKNMYCSRECAGKGVQILKNKRK